LKFETEPGLTEFDNKVEQYSESQNFCYIQRKFMFKYSLERSSKALQLPFICDSLIWPVKISKTNRSYCCRGRQSSRAHGSEPAMAQEVHDTTYLVPGTRLFNDVGSPAQLARLGSGVPEKSRDSSEDSGRVDGGVKTGVKDAGRGTPRRRPSLAVAPAAGR